MPLPVGMMVLLTMILMTKTTLRATGPASLINCRGNFMDPDSGTISAMSAISNSGSVVVFGDTNSGLHCWARPQQSSGDANSETFLNSMRWEPEPVLTTDRRDTGGFNPHPTFHSSKQQEQEQPEPQTDPKIFVSPFVPSPASSLAFLPHRHLHELQQPLMSEIFLQQVKRDVLPQGGQPIVRIRAELAKDIQVRALECVHQRLSSSNVLTLLRL